MLMDGRELLKEFEASYRLGPTKACRVLGLAYTTYSEYKNGRRMLPPYVRASVMAHMALPAAARIARVADAGIR